MTDIEKDLQNRFDYHAPPNDAVGNLHGRTRQEIYKAALFVARNTPVCREQSVAFTKLEEAMMWANAAIARNHDLIEPPLEAPLDDPSIVEPEPRS